MGSSGFVDWHRLDRTLPWVRRNTGQSTYVYAFWLVDYGKADKDTGVSLFKPDGAHPDWFIHSDTADHVLAAYTNPHTLISPNFERVFDNKLASRPLLGSLLLGTTNAAFHGRNDLMWWCSHDDLTWWGRNLLKQFDKLYLRQSILVTFVDRPTDENGGSRDPRK